MTQSKHTPGPWATKNPTVDSPHIWIVGHAENKGDNGVIAKVGGNRDCETIEANALLIAAAPELLEALEEGLDALLVRYELDMMTFEGLEKRVGGEAYESIEYDDYQSSLNSYKKAKAAIAKARGQ